MEIVTRWFYDDDAKILCKKQGVITDKGEFEYGNNAYDFSIEKGYHFATKSEAILDAVKDIDADIEVLQRRKRFLLEQMEEYNAKTLPEPICFASTGVLTKIPKTRIVSPHRTEFHCVPLYQEPQLYAEPPARSPIPDVEISKAFCDESGVSIGDTIEDAFEAGVRFGEQYHGIKENYGN